MPIANFLKAKFILSWLFFIALALFIITPFAAVEAQSVKIGLDKTAQSAGLPSPRSGTISTYLASTLGKVLNIALSMVGVLFLGLMIYAGITWMLASGNDQAITKAKEMLISSTVGLIIVLSAYALTSFVGTQLIK